MKYIVSCKVLASSFLYHISDRFYNAYFNSDSVLRIYSIIH